MVQKLTDVAPEKSVFDGVERRIEKKDLAGKTFLVKAYSEKIKGTDGDFNVLLCKDEEGTFTTSANEIMMKRINAAVEAIGLNEEATTQSEFYLADEVEVTLQKRKSTTSGRDYFAFE